MISLTSLNGFNKLKKYLTIFYSIQSILSIVFGVITGTSKLDRITSTLKYNQGSIILILQNVLVLLLVFICVVTFKGSLSTLSAEDLVVLNHRKSRILKYTQRGLVIVIWLIFLALSIYVVIKIDAESNGGGFLQRNKWIFIPVIALTYKVICKIITKFESHRRLSSSTKSYIFKYFAFKSTILYLTIVLTYRNVDFNVQGMCKVTEYSENFITSYILASCLAKVVIVLLLPLVHCCTRCANYNFEFHYGEETVDYICDFFFICLTFGYSIYTFPLGLLSLLTSQFVDYM